MNNDDTLSLLIRARDYVRQTIDDLGGCDHSVGICMCEDIRLAEDLDKAIKEANGEHVNPMEELYP